MINLMYRVLETIVNKEQSGYLSPDEFNNVAHLTQEEIFRNYFEDINRDQIKENRGLASPGFGNLSHNESQRLERFSKDAELTITEYPDKDYDEAELPADAYFIDENGILNGSGTVVEKVSKSNFGYAKKSLASFTRLYPVYSRFENSIRIFPAGVIEPVTITYVRKPKPPKWTYRNIDGVAKFDPSSASFQDFELHTSEFSNIALKMLTHFGISLREAEVMQIAEQLKNTIIQKDNN